MVGSKCKQAGGVSDAEDVMRKGKDGMMGKGDDGQRLLACDCVAG
jgi:hypothetical protein